MPQGVFSQLNGTSLGHVVMAHTQSDNDELISRGLDVFGKHKEKWNKLACTAALEGLLQTEQFDVLLALANDMQRHDMKWDPSIFKMVALAYIRSGSIDKARQFLYSNAKRMQDDSALCYRELIEHYANTSGNVQEACQLYLEMFQHKLKLTFADWCNAFELALQLPDQTVYWSFRKQLWLNARNLKTDLPAHLMLPPPEGSEHRAFEQTKAETKSELYSDVALALKSFRDSQGANGDGLTVNVASKLLVTMTQHDRVSDCVEMWHYFKERGIIPRPFARVATFDALSKAKKYDRALEIFNTLMNDDVSPSARAYLKALNAAIKLRRLSYVTEVLRHMQEHGVNIAANDYINVITSCTRAKEWALALSMLSAMQNQGMKSSIPIVNLLLTGCGKDNFWNMVIEVYNGMPDDFRPLLDEKALASVLLAHSQAESEELQLRTVEICNVHKTICKPFPYMAAMVALLEAKQYPEVISLADDATKQRLKLTPLMYHSVVMAHIRSGSMDQARQLLDDNAKRMSNISVECYRELIQHYAKVCNDNLEASKLCVLMMQNNTKVNIEDWRTALELSLQLTDRSIYWELRKWLRLHGAPLNELRENLLLPEDKHQLDTAASLQS